MGHLLRPLVRAILKLNTRRYHDAILQHLAPLLPDRARILDVGCGDGALAEALMKHHAHLHIVGVDVQPERPAVIAKILADGRRLPFAAGAFEVVLAVDMLHHTHDIQGVLSEMTRVTGQRVLIKEHVWDGCGVSWLLLSLLDWVTNAPFGVECVYNYPTLERWYAYFGAVGLYCKGSVPVAHLLWRLNEKFNRLFVLEKAKGISSPQSGPTQRAQMKWEVKGANGKK